MVTGLTASFSTWHFYAWWDLYLLEGWGHIWFAVLKYGELCGRLFLCWSYGTWRWEGWLLPVKTGTLRVSHVSESGMREHMLLTVTRFSVPFSFNILVRTHFWRILTWVVQSFACTHFRFSEWCVWSFAVFWDVFSFSEDTVLSILRVEEKSVQ